MGGILLILWSLASVISFSEGNCKCGSKLTDIIEGIERDGKLLHQNHMYQSEQYERINRTHFRVCQCNERPSLRKCCGREQMMSGESCLKQDGYTFTTEMIAEHNMSNFHVIYGNGCPASHFTIFYPDDYTNVHYRLLPNGSLSIYFDGNGEYRLQDFCIDNTFRPANNHSTKYSDLIVCIPVDPSLGIYEFPLGMIMSLPFLLSTLIVYSLREMNNIHSKNLSSHVASLLVAYISVIIVELTKPDIPAVLCIFLGFVRQFSFLSSFFWLNVMCFDVWWSLSAWSRFRAYSKSQERKRYSVYCICGWGFPALITMITAIMQFSLVTDGIIYPGMGFPNCFLRDGKPFYAYFYGPVIFIFCTDVTLFILSAARFIAAKRKTKSCSVQDMIYMKNVKTRYFLALKIFIMMGINWIIDPFSWIFEGSFWTWLFIHLSITFQALSTFIIFVCKTEIKRMLESRFCKNSYNENTSISLLTTPVGASTNKTIDALQTTVF